MLSISSLKVHLKTDFKWNTYSHTLSNFQCVVCTRCCVPDIFDYTEFKKIYMKKKGGKKEKGKNDE